MGEVESVGIIGGGQMAEALIKGFLDKKLFSPEEVLVSEPLLTRRQYLSDYYHIRVVEDNKEVIRQKKVVVLAVKPQVMKKVLSDIRDEVGCYKPLIITIAAGLPLAFYEKLLPEGTRLIRVMPNTCALVHEAISAIAKGTYASEDDIKIAETLFSAIGETLVLEENLIDGVTAVSGSGPAYVAAFFEALVDAGVKIGIPRYLAEKLALHTILGTAKLIKVTGKNPYELKAMVTSPGGTTIAALKELYQDGFYGTIIKAVEEAFKRSREISKAFS